MHRVTQRKNDLRLAIFDFRSKAITSFPNATYFASPEGKNMNCPGFQPGVDIAS
jgi:hypothetical protein